MKTGTEPNTFASLYNFVKTLKNKNLHTPRKKYYHHLTQLTCMSTTEAPNVSIVFQLAIIIIILLHRIIKEMNRTKLFLASRAK